MNVVMKNTNIKNIKMKTLDGTMFEVPYEWIVPMCGMIKDMVEEFEDMDDVIPLPNIVKGEILKKIIDYCEYHHNNRAEEIEKPLFKSLSEVINKWDIDYIQLSKEQLMELTMAANYIYCEDLLKLCCAAIADKIKDLNVEQMREFFNIENDFTPEEEQQIKEQNKWMCEDDD